MWKGENNWSDGQLCEFYSKLFANLAKRPNAATAKPVIWSEQFPFNVCALRLDLPGMVGGDVSSDPS